jgi:tetratricopeptide (TPR) repeat protein
VERLRLLPRGELLRPALLGFHHLGADLLWLRIVQVFGEQVVTEWDYEWLYHAFDVVTTLDPQYTYVYDVGGTVLAEFAHRVELSNQLLEKGFEANPTAWRLPFVLGFNHFFHLQDYVSAARYMSEAAQIPGHPFYVDTLAARLYVEGGSPALALQYLEAMIQQAANPELRRIYVEKYNEVLIARDLRALDEAVERYRKACGANPQTLSDLVGKGFLSAIPDEPFGGEYRVDPRTGEVSSSTHPERLRLYRPGDAGKFRKSI